MQRMDLSQGGKYSEFDGKVALIVAKYSVDAQPPMLIICLRGPPVPVI
jgi:hypothetical protein